MTRIRSARHSSIRDARAIAAVAVSLGAAGAMAGAQLPAAQASAPETVAVWAASARLPFYAGERLTYRVRGSKLAAGGKGTMTVDGPVDLRGTPTYLLRSTIEMRVGPVKAVNRTQSWLDPLRMASLRFQKYERTLISRQDEAVDLFPESKRWETTSGKAGEMTTDAPLDELSFIYFIRTLPLDSESAHRFDRYFDPSRNPTTVRVLGRETVTTGAGRFATIAVEMRVKDPARYRGEGVIRINFTDDGCRLPVRIESSVPVVGTAIMTLESHTHDPLHFATAGR